jgi:diketogulonate reductase-like aldo/keto reductase
MADKYSISTAQVLIRWCLQKGYITIPKSSNRDRIRENAQVFDLNISEIDMATLDAFDENFTSSWDPTVDP